MEYLLSEGGRRALEQFAVQDPLLAFDFDGTLAPIVASPDDARLSARTERLLERLSELYPCAVISGRKRCDAIARMGKVQMWGASGNHGADAGCHVEPYARAVQEWLPGIRSALAVHEGVLVEDKSFSVSVHYRNAKNRVAAIAAVGRVARGIAGARIIPGKQVLNLVPTDAPHKGIALDCIRRWSGCEVALYVGDDTTDEDAFAFDPERVMSVRVGRRRGSAADYYLRGQRQVNDLLCALVDLREHQTGRTRR